MKLRLLFTTTLFLLASAGPAVFVNGQGEVGHYRAIQEPISMPGVHLPEEAIKSGLGGTVRVPVIVDSGGSVVNVGEPAGPDAICKQVTRADVIAVRSAAKDIAKLARFAPIEDAESPLSEAWVKVVFRPTHKDETLAAGSENSTGDAPKTSGKSGKKKPAAEKYTIIGDANYSAAYPPPDYQGPVNIGGQGNPVFENADGEKAVRGGVLNGKAMTLPKPSYPPAARAVRASGAVSIQVLIDTNGEVFSAEAVSGHPFLRAASANAACEAKFSPTLLSGTPVKVLGVIVYNFLP